MTTNDERIAALAALGLTTEATFIPQHASRHAGDKDPSLNWRIKLLKNGREVLTSDYVQNMGHIPGYKQKLTVDELAGLVEICRTGRHHGKKLEPDALGFLACLLGDAGAIGYPTYEDYARDTGDDPDSRKGEAIYRECLTVGLTLRNKLGEDGFAKLREIMQNY